MVLEIKNNQNEHCLGLSAEGTKLEVQALNFQFLILVDLIVCICTGCRQFGLALTFNLDFSFAKWWIGSGTGWKSKIGHSLLPFAHSHLNTVTDNIR